MKAFLSLLLLLPLNAQRVTTVEIAAGTILHVWVRAHEEDKSIEHTVIRFATDHYTDGRYDPLILTFWLAQKEPGLRAGDHVKIMMGFAPIEPGKNSNCPFVGPDEEPHCGLRTLLEIEHLEGL